MLWRMGDEQQQQQQQQQPKSVCVILSFWIGGWELWGTKWVPG